MDRDSTAKDDKELKNGAETIVTRMHYSHPRDRLIEGLCLDKHEAITYVHNLLPYNTFGIRPYVGSRPGDDILLCLDLYDKKGDRLFRKPMANKDYFAVYDKKMLWRANLYIDEGGDKDWNNLHPWNAPPDATTEANWKAARKLPAWFDSDDWGFNEWNKPDGSKKNAVAGGQIVSIKQWTLWRNNITVTTSVAYGWGCMDSVNDFNLELSGEADLLAAARQKGSADYLGDDYRKFQWNNSADQRSIAPQGNWFNYIFQNRKTSGANDGYIYGVFDPSVSQHKYRLASNRAIVPGLSTFLDSNHLFNLFDQNNVDLALFANDPNKQSGSYDYTAGIDCSGFVSRAAEYSNSGYVISGKQSTTTLNYNSNSWLIQEIINDQAQNIEIPMLQYAVPGDILNKSGDHVVIILDIVPEGDFDSAKKRSQVVVIQSGAGPGMNSYQVLTNKTCGSNSGMGAFQKYQIRRLRAN